MRRAAAVPALAILLLGGCVGSRGAAPGGAARPPAAPAAAGERAAPPPAEELETFAVVRDDPAVALATRRLAAAPPAERAPLLLARARAAIEVAQGIRAEQGTAVRLPVSAPGYEKFIALYDLALRDLDEITVLHPGSPEMPKALYLLGLVHDYPHLDLFDEARAAYRLLIERYPASPEARAAAGRVRLLDSYMQPSQHDPAGR